MDRKMDKIYILNVYSAYEYDESSEKDYYFSDKEKAEKYYNENMDDLLYWTEFCDEVIITIITIEIDTQKQIESAILYQRYSQSLYDSLQDRHKRLVSKGYKDASKKLEEYLNDIRPYVQQ